MSVFHKTKTGASTYCGYNIDKEKAKNWRDDVSQRRENVHGKHEEHEYIKYIGVEAGD